MSAVIRTSDIGTKHQREAAEKLVALGYEFEGIGPSSEAKLRHPVAGFIRLHKSPSDKNYHTDMRHARRQLLAAGLDPDPQPKKEKKMPQGGVSAEKQRELEERNTRVIDYLTQHGPQPFEVIAEVAGLRRDSLSKTLFPKINVCVYQAKVKQGKSIITLQNQAPPPAEHEWKLLRGTPTYVQNGDVPKGAVATCGQVGPAEKPCIRAPGHWGSHRDNHGHEWVGTYKPMSLGELAVGEAGVDPASEEGQALAATVDEPEPVAVPKWGVGTPPHEAEMPPGIDVRVIDRQTGEDLLLEEPCGVQWTSQIDAVGDVTCVLPAGHAGAHVSERGEEFKVEPEWAEDLTTGHGYPKPPEPSLPSTLEEQLRAHYAGDLMRENERLRAALDAAGKLVASAGMLLENAVSGLSPSLPTVRRSRSEGKAEGKIGPLREARLFKITENTPLDEELRYEEIAEFAGLSPDETGNALSAAVRKHWRGVDGHYVEHPRRGVYVIRKES